MNILFFTFLDKGSDEVISNVRMCVMKPVPALPSCSKWTSRKTWYNKEKRNEYGKLHSNWSTCFHSCRVLASLNSSKC
jgi:hypothetical protein